MTYDAFISDYLKKGFLKKQKIAMNAIERLLSRSVKDLKTAKANLKIDEGIAYTVAYLAMLRAGRAFMLLRGFRPSDGFQHKTVVEFIREALGKEYGSIIDRFDRMRRKRNFFTYEIDITISQTEAIGALRSAENFVLLMIDRAKEESPQGQFKFSSPNSQLQAPN